LFAEKQNKLKSEKELKNQIREKITYCIMGLRINIYSKLFILPPVISSTHIPPHIGGDITGKEGKKGRIE